MISFLLEIVFEIVVEGTFEAAGSKRVPIWIRILLAAAFLIIAGGIIAVILALGIMVAFNQSFVGGALLVMLSLLLMFLMIYRIRCIYNEHKENRKINI